jgi:F-type H+-transporting ATPase subunit b
VERFVSTRRMSACEFMHTVRRSAVAVTVLALAAATRLAAAAQEEAEHHESSLADLFWPVINFAIMCGVLYYFLKTPLSNYLKDRSETIRRDLVEAATLKSSATAQLEQIDRKLRALPGDIETLRERGKTEVAAEEQRIMQQAAAERDRLVDQARRDIDVQVRLAKRALTEHAVDLSMRLAADRLSADTTEADHDRLVRRYLGQVKR